MKKVTNLKSVPLLWISFTLISLQMASPAAETEINRAILGMFQPLPEVVDSPSNPLTEAKIDLGRKLYYDTRISADRTVSCNTCHALDSYGDDGAPVSTGIKGQKGTRSAPTVYNAALHIAQFWDGREPDVERQAMGPPLNPIEMGMHDANHIVTVLKSIPGYVNLFGKAFPDDGEKISYENFGKAIGAFERRLLTPAPWDSFLRGDDAALNDEQKEGLQLFITKGCITCHQGAGVGGHMYQKLGLVKPWPGLTDKGRGEVKGFEALSGFFKVPSLRNVTETAPYMHDGSVTTIEDAVRKMAEYQQGHVLSDEETGKLIEFLKALKGEIPHDYIKEPELPADGPDTPKPSAPGL